MRSKQLLRTCPTLSANWRLAVTADGRMSLETINSDPELADVRLKGVPLHPDSYLDQAVPALLSGVPPEVGFAHSERTDARFVYSEYSDQRSDTYRAGAAPASYAGHAQEFEYFAPVLIGDSLPEWFFVLRADGPVGPGTVPDAFSQMKPVVRFDLRDGTAVGRLLRRSYPLQDRPSLDVSFESGHWRLHGWNYLAGGRVSRSFSVEDLLSRDVPFYRLEKLLSDSYREYGVVHPRLLNATFLFDDRPSDPSGYSDWSVSRYYGFYAERLETVAAYTPAEMSYEFVENPDLAYEVNGTLKVAPTYVLRSGVFMRAVTDSVGAPILSQGAVQYTEHDADPVRGGWSESRSDRYWFFTGGAWKKISRTPSTQLTQSNTVAQTHVFAVVDQFRPTIEGTGADGCFASSLAELADRYVTMSSADGRNRVLSGGSVMTRADVSSSTGLPDTSAMSSIWALTASVSLEEWLHVKETAEVDPSAQHGDYSMNGARLRTVSEVLGAITGAWGLLSDAQSAEVESGRVVLHRNGSEVTYLDSFSNGVRSYSIRGVTDEEARANLESAHASLVQLASETVLNAAWDHASLYVAEIGGRLACVQWDSVGLYLNADWSADTYPGGVSFFDAGTETRLDTKNLAHGVQPPVLTLYRVAFTEVSDFDFRRSETDQFLHEYDDPDRLTDTLEPKMHAADWSSGGAPYAESVDGFTDGGPTEGVRGESVPVSSEYMALGESLVLDERGLTRMWDLNQTVPKWGYAGSSGRWQSAYRLNLCSAAGTNNFSPDADADEPSWESRSFDYCVVNWPQDLALSACAESSAHAWRSWGFANSIPVGSSLLSLDPMQNDNAFDVAEFMSARGGQYAHAFFSAATEWSGGRDFVGGLSEFVNAGDSVCAMHRGSLWKLSAVDYARAGADGSLSDAVTSPASSAVGYAFSVVMSFTNDAVRSYSGSLDRTTGADTRQWTPVFRVLVNEDERCACLSVEIPTAHYVAQDGSVITAQEPGATAHVSNSLYDVLRLSDAGGGRVDRTLYAGRIGFADRRAVPDVSDLSISRVAEALSDFTPAAGPSVVYNVRRGGVVTEYGSHNRWGSGSLPYHLSLAEPASNAVYDGSYEFTERRIGDFGLPTEDRSPQDGVTGSGAVLRRKDYLKPGEWRALTYSESQVPEEFSRESFDSASALLVRRHGGPYDVITREVRLFSVGDPKPKLYPSAALGEDGAPVSYDLDYTPTGVDLRLRYSLDPDLRKFATAPDQVIQKVSSTGSSVLVSRDSRSSLALSPRADEWGRATEDEQIFRSQWDADFYLAYGEDFRA